MAIGEERIEQQARGVSVRSTSREKTGIQAYLTLPASGGVGSGDGSYFNFFIGFGLASRTDWVDY